MSQITPFMQSVLDSIDEISTKLDQNIFIKNARTAFKENISQFEIKSKNIEKEEIYILNNDPISFFNLIIELNKKYHVKQLSKLDQLFLIEKEEKNPKIIIDISKLKNEDKQEIEKLSTSNLILFYENHINKSLESKALKVYQKPLNLDILISL